MQTRARGIFTVIVFFLVVASTARAQDLEYRPPPPGYSWEVCAEIKGAVLRPDGWHFAAATGTDNPVYYVTEQPLTQSEPFGTGFTLTVLRDSPEVEAMDPAEYVKTFIDSVSRAVAIERRWDMDLGSVVGRGTVVLERPDLEESKRRHIIALANTRTGTVFIIQFEALIADWDEAWPVIDPVLNRLVLDDEV